MTNTEEPADKTEDAPGGQPQQGGELAVLTSDEVNQEYDAIGIDQQNTKTTPGLSQQLPMEQLKENMRFKVDQQEVLPQGDAAETKIDLDEVTQQQLAHFPVTVYLLDPNAKSVNGQRFALGWYTTVPKCKKELTIVDLAQSVHENYLTYEDPYKWNPESVADISLYKKSEGFDGCWVHMDHVNKPNKTLEDYHLIDRETADAATLIMFKNAPLPPPEHPAWPPAWVMPNEHVENKQEIKDLLAERKLRPRICVRDFGF